MAVLLNEAQTHHCGSEDPSLSAYFLPSHQHLDRCSVFQKSTLFSPSWDLSATLSVDLLLLIPQPGTCSPIFSTFPDGSLLQGPAKPSFLRRPSQTVQSPWDFLVLTSLTMTCGPCCVYSTHHRLLKQLMYASHPFNRILSFFNLKTIPHTT